MLVSKKTNNAVKQQSFIALVHPVGESGHDDTVTEQNFQNKIN